MQNYHKLVYFGIVDGSLVSYLLRWFSKSVELWSFTLGSACCVGDIVGSAGFFEQTGLDAVSTEGIATQLTIVPNNKVTSSPNLSAGSSLEVVVVAGAGRCLWKKVNRRSI